MNKVILMGRLTQVEGSMNCHSNPGSGFKDRAERERFFRLLGGAGRLKALSEKLEEEGTIGNLLTDQQ